MAKAKNTVLSTQLKKSLKKPKPRPATTITYKGLIMTYNIRFLKSGHIQMESDIIFTPKSAQAAAEHYLSTLPDHTIIEAMADYSPKASMALGTRFDMDLLDVQCVEEVNAAELEYRDIFITPLWDEYAYRTLTGRIEQLEYELYRATNPD
jgi:hypothetical protein